MLPFVSKVHFPFLQIQGAPSQLLPSFPQISNVTNPVFAAVQSQPNFQPSVPQHSMQNDTISPNALLHNAMSDITRFMYRKDFLLSRLNKFSLRFMALSTISGLP
jgi:hypothetical protein